MPSLLLAGVWYGAGKYLDTNCRGSECERASDMTGPTEHTAIPADRPIRIGISTCLLGEKVRFDGGHKHDRYLTHTLGEYFQWVPVCPEVELGLGTPRETLRLEQGEE